MTTRLGALADRISGQSFGLTNYDVLEADVNYLAVAGADQPSGATVQVLAEFFGVTGTTTITNLSDPDGASEGQQARLWIKGGPLTIQNNGGGAGNIRTRSGSDTLYPQNAIVTFVYDGAVWREQSPGDYPGQQLDYAQITSPTANAILPSTEATGLAVVTGNAVVYGGDRVKLEFSCAAIVQNGGNLGVILGTFWRDSSPIGQFDLAPHNENVNGPAVKAELFDTPAAGSHTYAVKMWASGGTNPSYSVQAGAGGAGVYVPAFLRVTRA